MQTRTMNAQANTRFSGRKRPRWMRPGLLWFAFDMLAPTGLFYLMIDNGASIYLGLLASALLSAISAIISFLRGKGGQRFAPYMLAMALASLAIALVTGSDRFLLAKESVLTAIVGFWFLGSIWTSRPLAYRFTRPMLEGRFGWEEPSWDVIWEQAPRFRRIWYVSTAMWGVATLIDAVLRVVMAYTLPVDSVPALQTGMFIGTGLLMQVITNVYYVRAGLWRLIRERSANPGGRRPTWNLQREKKS